MPDKDRHKQIHRARVTVSLPHKLHDLLRDRANENHRDLGREFEVVLTAGLHALEDVRIAGEIDPSQGGFSVTENGRTREEMEAAGVE